MPPDQVKTAELGHAAITDVAGIKEQSLLQRVLASQAFWVTIALLILVAVMAAYEPSFGKAGRSDSGKGMRVATKLAYTLAYT